MLNEGHQGGAMLILACGSGLSWARHFALKPTGPPGMAEQGLEVVVPHEVFGGDPSGYGGEEAGDELVGEDGGDCDFGCYNHPRKAVALTTQWKQYTVQFASAGQGASEITNRLQEVAWLAPLDADWDYSIDEIAFYKGTPPTGPIGGAK